MWRKFGMILACLALTGCFEAETGMSFRDDGMVEGTSIITLERMFYEMGAGTDEGFCDDGELIESEVTVSCVTTELMTVADAITKSVEEAEPVPGQPEQPEFVMEEVSPGEVLVLMPIGATLAANQMEQDPSMPDPAAMMEMMGIDITGKAMHFWIEAPEILESSQEITKNGTRTELIIPVADVFAGTIPADQEFRVLLRYK